MHLAATLVGEAIRSGLLVSLYHTPPNQVLWMAGTIVRMFAFEPKLPVENGSNRPIRKGLDPERRHHSHLLGLPFRKTWPHGRCHAIFFVR